MCNECAEGTGLARFRRKKTLPAQVVTANAGPTEQTSSPVAPVEESPPVPAEESSCDC